MLNPGSSNLYRLVHLAAALRPAFRCPLTPEPLRQLYAAIVEASAGGHPLNATEAALRAVIMLSNATALTSELVPGPHATIETADSDPDIGLHLALFGVETLLERFGWSVASAA